jgi:hypothetical protein
MRAATVIATAVLVTATSASAADATTYRGKTKQGRHASIVTAADGTPTRALIGWQAPCRREGFVYRNKTLWLPPFVSAAPGQLQDGGVLHRRLRNGLRARSTLSITGSLRADGNWRGVFRVKVMITRHGRWVDTCRLKRDRWVAHPVG